LSSVPLGNSWSFRRKGNSFTLEEGRKIFGLVFWIGKLEVGKAVGMMYVIVVV
jgi:hypothetical protein